MLRIIMLIIFLIVLVILSKYNFIILPLDSKETIKIYNKWGAYIRLIHPQTLNFTSDSSLTIQYIMMTMKLALKGLPTSGKTTPMSFL